MAFRVLWRFGEGLNARDEFTKLSEYGVERKRWALLLFALADVESHVLKERGVVFDRSVMIWQVFFTFGPSRKGDLWPAICNAHDLERSVA